MDPAQRAAIEQARQERIAELAAEYGPRWPVAFQPGSFGCHELLDRTMMAAAIVGQYVVSHPSCVQHPEWYALARQAHDALDDLYQRVAAAHLDETPEPGADPAFSPDLPPD